MVDTVLEQYSKNIVAALENTQKKHGPWESTKVLKVEWLEVLGNSKHCRLLQQLSSKPEIEAIYFNNYNWTTVAGAEKTIREYFKILGARRVVNVSSDDSLKTIMDIEIKDGLSHFVELLENALFFGDSDKNTHAFDGLDKLCQNKMNLNGDFFTALHLEKAIDLVSKNYGDANACFLPVGITPPNTDKNIAFHNSLFLKKDIFVGEINPQVLSFKIAEYPICLSEGNVKRNGLSVSDLHLFANFHLHAPKKWTHVSNVGGNNLT